MNSPVREDRAILADSSKEPGSFDEWIARKYPDDQVTRFGRSFFQADVAHIMMLHAAGMKAGLVVNGREELSPWAFTRRAPHTEDR